MITATNITDSQLREVEQLGRVMLREANKIIAAAVAAQTKHRGQRAARARCAEILNARAKESK